MSNLLLSKLVLNGSIYLVWYTLKLFQGVMAHQVQSQDPVKDSERCV